MNITIEDKIAAQALARRGSLKVSGVQPRISKLRARALIENGLAVPAQLEPLPDTIYPTAAAMALLPSKGTER